VLHELPVITHSNGSSSNGSFPCEFKVKITTSILLFMPLFQSLLRTPYTSTLSFALGLLFFFLPFAEFRCTPKKRKGITASMSKALPVKISGFGMMMGKVKKSKIVQAFAEGVLPKSPVAIVSFFAGMVGFLFSWIDFRARAMVIVITGTLASLCLIIVRLTFSNSIGRGIQLQRLSISKEIVVSFTPWFYLSVFCFAIAALSGYLRGLFLLEAQYLEKIELSGEINE
jgi:hypothetical protein